MDTGVGDEAHRTDGQGHPQDQTVQPTGGADADSQEQLDSNAVQEQVVQAAQPALEEMRERMARVVHEQKEQTAQNGPSGREERQPAQEAEGQTDTGGDSEADSDREQATGRSGQMPPEESRSNRDRQGDNAMATQNPGYAARAGLLRMARQWRDTGSTHQAVDAYKEILTNYPGTQAAAAATEELTELAQMMENQGQYHSALEVFKMLEQFGVER